MRALMPAAAALLAACYEPRPQPGAPCLTRADCPVPLICSQALTCEFDGTSTPGVDAGIDAPGCTTEICGNGIDEDCSGADLPCAPNDLAAGAVDITGGGTFTGDALLANDDVAANGCGGEGGRDLFFRITLNAPQVYYFDTLGSSYDTVIRVYRKSCAAVGTGAGAATCSDDACGGDKSQTAVSLPAGESCIVVDQRDGAQPTGDLKLRVVRGGRNALPLDRGTRTSSGDTCTSTSTADSSDMGCALPGAKDVAYFFTACPGETLRLDADICPVPNWDPALYVKRVDGTELACDDDSCDVGPRFTGVTITGSTLYYLFVDGYEDGDCGPYQLDTNLRL